MEEEEEEKTNRHLRDGDRIYTVYSQDQRDAVCKPGLARTQAPSVHKLAKGLQCTLPSAASQEWDHCRGLGHYLGPVGGVDVPLIDIKTVSLPPHPLLPLPFIRGWCKSPFAFSQVLTKLSLGSTMADRGPLWMTLCLQPTAVKQSRKGA